LNQLWCEILALACDLPLPRHCLRTADQQVFRDPERLSAVILPIRQLS
jgi:hypothetical protein